MTVGVDHYLDVVGIVDGLSRAVQRCLIESQFGEFRVQITVATSRASATCRPAG